MLFRHTCEKKLNRSKKFLKFLKSVSSDPWNNHDAHYHPSLNLLMFVRFWRVKENVMNNGQMKSEWGKPILIDIQTNLVHG